MKKITFTDVSKLIVALFVCQFAGLLSFLVTIPTIPVWYTTLNKPFFTAPNWLFAPVWTILFLLMGFSLFLVWRQGFKKKKVRQAMCVFSFQFVLNILWSALFFGLKSPGFAFAEILVLLFAIVLNITFFYPISKRAAWLLAPYFIWVIYASMLNYAVWIMN
jgi:translocator protein